MKKNSMKKNSIKRMTKADLVLIGILLLTGLTCLLAVRLLVQKDGAKVRILSDGQLYGTYRLTGDQEIPIQKEGEVVNILKISDRKAKMKQTDVQMKKTAYMGLFLSLALICSYIESLIPFYFGIPGVKLGLTNIVVILALYQMGCKYALTISMLRIVLAGLLFGNLFSILYSLAGGLLSFCMIAL